MLFVVYLLMIFDPWGVTLGLLGHFVWVKSPKKHKKCPKFMDNLSSETPLGAIWDPFGDQVPEMFKMRLLKPSGSHLATRCQSEAIWQPSGSHLITSKVTGNTANDNILCISDCPSKVAK